VKTEKWKIAPV